MKREIKVNQIKELEQAWKFEVEVEENGTKTRHLVTVDKDYFTQFANKFPSVEILVEKSFEFLLHREPKESILKEFNLTVIEQYFPEYKEKVKNLTN